jgi:chromosome segregation protein
MRLRKIKLAGFKSFVDPTTLQVPSNLVGVIGPNGCGKSNVIDAVRWVMGESSAKTLRGESMADVIFNGSTSRKPVGLATVELVFENSRGRIGGQFAEYNEISVRRQVERSGQSQYFLNSTRCRRRDITDLFLGTGLGPRSYSIIEQGMISRVIEARPEELRTFLEEAAGISLYKERRHETETRIRHTRENLERLDDLREELEGQLKRLKRQSDAAIRFQELKTEEHALKANLQALRLRGLEHYIQDREAQLRAREVDLEQQLVELRRTEADLEAQRELAHRAGEAVNDVQAEVFKAKGEVARLEQAIGHARDRRRKLRSDLDHARQELARAGQDLEADAMAIAELEAELAASREQTGMAEARREEAQARREAAEQAVADWQAQWEAFHRDAAEPERRAEVERARLTHMEQQMAQLQLRMERLDQEDRALEDAPLERELEELQQQVDAAAQRMQDRQATVHELQGQVGHQRDRNHDLAVRLDETRRRVQHERGRMASLETLQQAALGKGRGAVKSWLREQGLEAAPRLAQELEVEPGWERAVEVVLGDHLEAVCTDGLAARLDALAGLGKGTLSLIDTSAPALSAAGPGGPALADRVRLPWAPPGLLHGIRTASDPVEAWRMLPSLGAGDSVVTPDGTWLGPGWLRVAHEKDEHSGVLGREQELRQLQDELPELERESDELREHQEEGNQQLHTLEQHRQAELDALHLATREHAQLQSKAGARRTRLEQVRARRERLRAERDELGQELEETAMEAESTRSRLHRALERMEALVDERLELEQRRDSLRAAAQEAVQAARAARDECHRLEVTAHTLTTRRHDTERNRRRAEAQVEQWQRRAAELQAQLDASDDPETELAEQREEWLQVHIEQEARLSRARDDTAELDAAIRELDQARRRLEQAFNERKNVLQEAHIALQEQRVRRQTIVEQLQEAGEDIPALLAGLPREVDEAAWQERLEQIGRAIQRLGAINLAAIEEFRDQSRRKEHLDSQHADLTEALETLEQAIRRIDRETRERFKATFDQVNTGIQSMFPRLFGGGEAYLDLTDRDLLEAGVTIMARPPGKRNSSIHLLSGGEKALTAVALVFAIFGLNPAPFCMLDEVDAPLDDANVGRFGRMVQAMSDQTQFIFVTHNKTTMEIAEHLTGVTMQEPGVSRLVAVDIDQAVELAVQ